MTKRKKHIISTISLVLFILLFALINTWISKSNSKVKDSDIIRQQLNTALGTAYVYEALLDDGSIICVDYSSEKGAEYFRYYCESDILERIGTVENFILNMSGMVQIDQSLYFFSNVDENGEAANTLFCIDTDTNTLTAHPHNDGSVAGIPIFLYGDDVATMKNVVDGDLIYTFVDWYDRENDEWHQEHLHTYNSETREGSAIVLMYSDETSLYLLLDIYTAPGVYDTWLKQYDFRGNELQSIVLPDKIDDFFQQGRLFKMTVIDDYIYIADVSGYGCLGRIENNSISLIHTEEAMTLSVTSTPPNDRMVFFVRWTNIGYLLDFETGLFSEFELALPEGQSICNFLIADNEIVINCYEDYANTVLYETNLDLVLSNEFSIS